MISFCWGQVGLQRSATPKTLTPPRRHVCAESCIPLYGLQEAGRLLFAPGDMSWLDAYHEPQVSRLLGVPVCCVLMIACQHAFESGVFQSVDPSIIPPSVSALLLTEAIPTSP